VVEVPASLGEVDAAWMTAALRDAGHDDAEVTELTYEPLKGIVGALGEVGVFELRYARDAGLPAKLLGKCPLDNDSARLYNSIMRYYRRETGFYRDLAAEVPMRVPRCWVNLSDDADKHILLLEYFEDAIPGDVLAGTSFDKVLRLIGDMARMHGAHWMDQKASDLPWMFHFTEESLLFGFDVARATWPMALAAEPGLVPDDLAALVEGPYLSEVTPQQWIQAYNERPWTLVHGDYELENVLFAGDDIVVIDWQGVMVGFPAMDLGFTLAISGTDETVARERELMDHYRAVLAESGGPSWSHNELLDDLAWSMLFFAVGQTIPFMEDYASMGPQGDRLHQRMVAAWRGCVKAAIRWDTAGRVTPPAG
jgi:hypothetical protein